MVFLILNKDSTRRVSEFSGDVGTQEVEEDSESLEGRVLGSV